MVRYFCAATHVAVLGLFFLFFFFFEFLLRGSTLGGQTWRLVHPNTVTALGGGQ